jgi:hypothetical protein
VLPPVPITNSMEPLKKQSDLRWKQDWWDFCALQEIWSVAHAAVCRRQFDSFKIVPDFSAFNNRNIRLILQFLSWIPRSRSPREYFQPYCEAEFRYYFSSLVMIFVLLAYSLVAWLIKLESGAPTFSSEPFGKK